ncbi:cell division protein Fic [Mycoavidus sp. B2-EB]|nr:cell division protein Fic [Mycoavidus sp. B2-EB]
MADALLYEQQTPLFSWGGARLVEKGDARIRYLEALRAADKGDMRLLLAFVRT